MNKPKLIPLKVLVFGETGVGKTSMLNEMTGEKHKVSDSAQGCTFDTTPYKPTQVGCCDVTFIDTVGLGEAKGGTVAAEEAIKTLEHFIKRNKDGFNLLILCARAGRITEICKKNYEIFVNEIFANRIPVVFVATGCENSYSLDQWPRQNEDEIRQRYKIECVAIIGSVWAVGNNEPFEKAYSQLRYESKQRLSEVILKYATIPPVAISPNALDKIKDYFSKFFTKLFG